MRWLGRGWLLRLTTVATVATATLLFSCSSQRQRHRVTSWEQERIRQLEVDSSRVEFWTHRQVLRLAHAGQQAVILPEGPFWFRPDSGFRGEAALVLLEQWSASRSLQSDSVVGSGGWHRETQRSDSSDRFDASDEQAVSRTVGFQVGGSRGWWRRLGTMLVGAAGLVALLRFLRKRLMP